MTAVYSWILLLDSTNKDIETVGSALENSFYFIVVSTGSATAKIAAKLTEPNLRKKWLSVLNWQEQHEYNDILERKQKRQ